MGQRETLDKLNKILDQNVSKLSGHEKGGQRGQTDTVPDQRRQGRLYTHTGISGGILEQRGERTGKQVNRGSLA